MNKTRLDVICEKAIKAAIQEREFLHEGSLRVLLVEGIDEEDQSELAKQVDAAHKTIDSLLSMLPETWGKTKGKLQSFKYKLPDAVDIFRLDLKGDKTEIAKKVSESTVTIKYVNSILDSLSNFSKLSNKMWKIISKTGVTDTSTDDLDLTGALPLAQQKLKDVLNSGTKKTKFNVDDIANIVEKSYTWPNVSKGKKGWMTWLIDMLGKGDSGQPATGVWDKEDFKEDVLNSSFSDLNKLTNRILKNSKKIEQKTEKSDEQIGAIVKSVAPEISAVIKTSEPAKAPTKPSIPSTPVTPVKTRPEDKRAAAAVSRAKTRVKAPPAKQSTPAQPVPRKKVKILGDIVKYRDPENRDKGFVYAEPKGVDLMNAISMMSKNPNAKSRSAFKDAMNAVVGEEIFEQKKTGDDIIVEKWQRLAGIKR
jgi:hypothetical protein